MGRPTLFICIRPLKYVGNGPVKLQKTFPAGEGGPQRRWMRGGTALYVVGTMGAEVETFLRIRLQFLECFTPPRPSSVRAMPCQLPRRGSFCTGLWGGGFTGTPQGSSQNLPRRGRGTARRRWMRGGTALPIVGTTGAKGILPSLTVGNGLCAVPLRCNYNPCGQNGTTPRYVIPRPQ